MRLFYNLFIYLLRLGMGLGAMFNYKLKRGLAGRRRTCHDVSKTLNSNDEVIWMHAASLGEYEQGLPVLKELHDKMPSCKILVTFFSPSGYEHIIKKKPEFVDCITYLPFDTKTEVVAFTSLFKTKLFFTVKYDFWYNLLEELKVQGAKTFVISALFYESQVYFKPYGGWFVKELKRNLDWIFNQTKHSTALVKSLGITTTSTSGDTRYDRVKELRKRDNSVPYISEFLQNKLCLVFGSSWEAEERIAQMIAQKTEGHKIIIAPHDMKRVDALKAIFPHALLYSEVNDIEIQRLQTAEVLIIDSIGLLSKLYSYAHVAVVGGGFHSAGLHNILEAATFYKPVFIGNQYRKNPEADALIVAGGAKSFEDEFYAAPFIVDMLSRPQVLEDMGKAAGQFIDEQPNSTEIVLKKVMNDLVK